MSIAAITAVTTRVAEIQNRMGQIAPGRTSFDQALRSAQELVEPPGQAGTTLVTPQRTLGTEGRFPAPSIRVGIMGTPVLLRSDLSAAAYQTTGSADWAQALPTAGQAWAPAIEEAAGNAGIDPRLLAAVVWQESGFQPDAVSRSGAIGLAQLMPATAEGLGVDPHNPIENLDGGARYLAWTIREFGSLDLGLAAYNAGPGTVRSAGGIPNISETQAYVPGVIDYYRQLGGIA